MNELGNNAALRVISVRDLVDFARRRWVAFVLAGLFCFGVVYLIASLRVPVYTAQTTLLYRPNQNDFANVNVLASGLDANSATINNEIAIIRSTGLLSRVVDRAGLHQDPEFTLPRRMFDLRSARIVLTENLGFDVFGGALSLFGWDQAGEAGNLVDDRPLTIATELAAAKLRSRIAVERERFSNSFTVSVQSIVPEKATLLTNTVADVYIDDQLEAKFADTRRATNWLSERIAELEARVRDSETAAADKRAEFSEVAGRDVSTISQQIAQVSAQLVTARSALTTARSRYEIARARRERGEAVGSAGVQASEAAERLLQLRTELRRREAELNSRYLEKHPKLIAVREDLRETERRLGQAVDSAVGDAEVELRAAEVNVGNLAAELRRLERQSQAFRQAEVAIRQLDREAEADRNLYETYLGRLRETAAKEDVQSADVRILQRALGSNQPAGIPSLYLALVGGFVGAFGWIIGGFGISMLRAGFSHREEIEDELGETVISVVPEIARRKLERGVVEYLQAAPGSGFAEAFRTAKSIFDLQRPQVDTPVVCVTSSVPGEGKTTLASGLAFEASKSNRVLLIEGDLRRPSFESRVLLRQPAFGLVDVLTAGCSLQDGVVSLERSQLDILFAKQTSADSLRLLESSEFAALINVAKSEYDFIVIDAPPVLATSDAIGLGKVADAFLYAVPWRSTEKGVVRAGLKALKNGGCSVFGIIMTRFDTQRGGEMPGYYFENYSHYNSYYRG